MLFSPRKYWTFVCCILGFALLWNSPIFAADLELADLFTDHMIMQRAAVVPVWGWAEPGEEVSVSIDGQTKKIATDKNGKWMVKLDPIQTGSPRIMTVKGKIETVSVSDILLGDVWVCAGQSNMAWCVSASKDAAKEIQEASYPEIRLFEVAGGKSPKAARDRFDPKNHAETMGGQRDLCVWRPCDSTSVKDFSAVGYYFGRSLYKDLKIPVGLIHTSVGGTPVEAWLSGDAFAKNPDLKMAEEHWRAMDAFAETDAGKQQLKLLAEAAEKKYGKVGWKGDSWLAPLNRAGHPSTFFNSRVQPLIPFAIKGVVWYQGEGNTWNAFQYRSFFPALINDWRGKWGQGDFPFLFVQLAGWGGEPPPKPMPSEWAELRESQAMALKLPNTGMAVAIDLGDPRAMHPLNKQEVGARLALTARALVYGEKIVSSGPVYRESKIEGNKIRVSFNYVGNGLVAKDGPLKSFAIAGEDQKFVWANCEIQGDSILLSADEVKQPVAVRYGWYHNPGCNLYNAEGLPAVPFRTDDWPGVTDKKGYSALLKKPLAFDIPK